MNKTRRKNSRRATAISRENQRIESQGVRAWILDGTTEGGWGNGPNRSHRPKVEIKDSDLEVLGYDPWYIVDHMSGHAMNGPTDVTCPAWLVRGRWNKIKEVAGRFGYFLDV